MSENVPKSDFSVFGSQKRLVAPRLADVPVGNGFLMFFRSPGAKMRLLRSKVTFSQFFDFGAQKSLLGGKMTFERKSDFWAPGTRKWTNISLVFKGLGAIGANGDFRRRRNNFRGRLYENHEITSGIPKKIFFENAKNASRLSRGSKWLCLVE